MSMEGHRVKHKCCPRIPNQNVFIQMLLTCSISDLGKFTPHPSNLVFLYTWEAIILIPNVVWTTA